MMGHIWFIGVSSVHPGQMVTEINFKFCKGLKGIKIILAPHNIIILDKLDKTVKIDILLRSLAEISTLLHNYYRIDFFSAGFAYF